MDTVQEVSHFRIGHDRIQTKSSVTETCVRLGEELWSNGQRAIILTPTIFGRDTLTNAAEFHAAFDRGNCEIRTFHSFARRLINEMDEEEFETNNPYTVKDNFFVFGQTLEIKRSRFLVLLSKSCNRLEYEVTEFEMERLLLKYDNIFFKERVPMTNGHFARSKLEDRGIDVAKIIEGYERLRLEEGYYGFSDLIEIATTVIHVQSDWGDYLKKLWPAIIVDHSMPVSRSQVDFLLATAKWGVQVVSVEGSSPVCINDFDSAAALADGLTTQGQAPTVVLHT